MRRFEPKFFGCLSGPNRFPRAVAENCGRHWNQHQVASTLWTTSRKCHQITVATNAFLAQNRSSLAAGAGRRLDVTSFWAKIRCTRVSPPSWTMWNVPYHLSGNLQQVFWIFSWIFKKTPSFHVTFSPTFTWTTINVLFSHSSHAPRATEYGEWDLQEMDAGTKNAVALIVSCMTDEEASWCGITG